MAPPAVVAELVDRFDSQRDAYRSGQYNEAQLRQEFLNPFFDALGWDVYNRKGYAEPYKEVIHEAGIKVGGRTKAPDYCFRVGGGVPSFFVEAKKPSVDIRGAISPAYQLRRYAWSAKLPVSILTDFEEFAVYDCRVRPVRTDQASTARVIYHTYTQYVDCWDELAGLFSPEAIRRGDLDKFIASKKVKKGTAQVDDAFLDEIQSWREVLARNIALRNPKVSQRDLNFAVQRTIDRIVFLRICEDRGIEPYGTLQTLLNGPNVYPRLTELFQRADERYNSGLFYFTEEKGRGPADELTLGLSIDDKALKDIIKELYYPDSPYEFSVLPVEILGHVYEQFLGKVIRLTRGHRAVVEDKPEVKKAGGVYYSPTYIVDYIVQHTVGKLLQGGRGTAEGGRGTAEGGRPEARLAAAGTAASVPHAKRLAAAGTAASVPHTKKGKAAKGLTPKQAAKLRILDPACGSGSFLIGAYQYLLDWHRDWYETHDPEKHARGRNPKLYRGRAGDWRLTTAERKRILLNNIYGVDIDPQAVEVTKLSLLLKVLEGESQETLSTQLRLFHERALPDLASNIKCGNSLIGPDFYKDRQMSLFDQEEIYRINAFDWKKEFREIFKRNNGGFDAVIGNPPYVRQEGLKQFKPYFKQRYRSFESTADLYVYFIERALKLLRDGGRMSYIVSSGFLRTSFGRPLRQFIRETSAVDAVVDFGGLAIFAGAKDTYVCVPLMRKGEQPQSVKVTKVASLEALDLPLYVAAHAYPVSISRFTSDAWSTDDEATWNLFQKLLGRCVPLGEYVHDRIFLGIKTGLNKAFEIDAPTRQRLIDECPACAALIHPFLGGQDIRRYHVRDNKRYLIAIPAGWTRDAMQARNTRSDLSERAAWKWLSDCYGPLARHVLPFADAGRKRCDKGEYWWELRSCDYYRVLGGPKIIYPDIAKGPRFYLDMEGTYIRNTAYCVDSCDAYLLAILNSRLGWWAIARISIPFGTRAGEYRYRLFTQYVRQIPIHVIDRAKNSEESARQALAEQVAQVCALHAQLATVKSSHDKTALQRHIYATDRQIDRLVYELYELTDEEIAVVEDATR